MEGIQDCLWGIESVEWLPSYNVYKLKDYLNCYGPVSSRADTSQKLWWTSFFSQRQYSIILRWGMVQCFHVEYGGNDDEDEDWEQCSMGNTEN